MRPDFSLIWGADNAPFTPIEASDYTAGWVFRTGAPPRRVNFDYWQNLSDQRTTWLGEQMLLAVGHEWQNDVTYDAYAVTRSPVNGRIYHSLVGGNLNNEPSVSGAQWAEGVANFATPAETIAGLSTSLATNPAGILAALTAFLPKRVFAANDFIRIPDVPGGLIIQWGQQTNASLSSGTVTYPLAYTTISGATVATATRVSAGHTVKITSTATANFTWESLNLTGAGPAAFTWISVGY